MKKPFYILVLANTKLSDREGVSAAGADPEAQRLTASLDAEFIANSKTSSAPSLPVSPAGIVSPALVSKACLNMLDAEYRIVNVGTFNKPKGIDPKIYFDLEIEAAEDFTQKDAFSIDEAEDIFLSSLELLSKLGFDKKKHELIISECVVGGTTTALNLLELLGYDAQDLIASSHKESNQELKKKILKEFKQRTKSYKLEELENPIYNCAIGGDKAQVLITGLTLSAMQNETKTTLAGGTQMLAIYALIQNLTEGFFMDDLVEITTSPWLINDESSDILALAKQINKNLKLKYLKDTEAIDDLLNQELAKFDGDYPAWPDIKARYNEGHVKEGLGMGALLYLTQSNS